MVAGLVFLAFVNVHVAVDAFKSFFALAFIETDTVDTFTESAGVALAFVDVDLATVTGSSRNAEAVKTFRIFVRELTGINWW